MTVEAIVRRAAALECAYAERWEAGDMEAHHPGEGQTLCYTECEPCQLRVDALEVLAAMDGGAA